jgi:3-oxoacyl-[acyl-carrier-protein] synthase-1
MFIDSTGMVCCVGLSAVPACAAMRAGIDGFEELPYITNQGDPIIGARVPELDPDLKRPARIVEMLVLALADCLGQEPALPTESIPLLVGLAEPDRPGGCAHLADSVVAAVQDKTGLKFHPQLSRGIPGGHTAGFEALRVARELLRTAGVPGCLVCGVDSYINAAAQNWLDQHWRLKREEHSNGVIPGEAAAAVYVSLRQPANPDKCVTVAGLGFGFEKAGILTEEPLRGDGLTEATRNALADARLQLHEVDFRISDVTGEQYGFKEATLALTRVLRSRRDKFPIWHSADCIGDTGAAAGVCELIIATQALRGNYAPGRTVICSCSSVPGDRAVAILRG